MKEKIEPIAKTIGDQKKKIESLLKDNDQKKKQTPEVRQERKKLKRAQRKYMKLRKLYNIKDEQPAENNAEGAAETAEAPKEEG